MSDNEIKAWKTQSVKHTMAAVLIMEKMPFSFDEENGIMFTAPEFYVMRLIECKYSLKSGPGRSLKNGPPRGA